MKMTDEISVTMTVGEWDAIMRFLALGVAASMHAAELAIVSPSEEDINLMKRLEGSMPKLPQLRVMQEAEEEDTTAEVVSAVEETLQNAGLEQEVTSNDESN